jgi:hypothetical protein
MAPHLMHSYGWVVQDRPLDVAWIELARPLLAGTAEDSPVTLARCHSLHTCYSHGSCLYR